MAETEDTQRQFRGKDRTGEKVGRLTVVRFAGWGNDRVARWECECECGRITIVRQSTLFRAKPTTNSCGVCVRKGRPTHGMSGTPHYNVWQMMLRRCEDPKSKSYERYGARGITVCEQWHSFENFYADMGPRPSDKHTLDRRENSEGYCKGNCRWSTIHEQNRNKRNNLFYEYLGKKKVLADWAAEYGINKLSLYYRIKRGWPIEKAITTPLDNRGRRSSRRKDTPPAFAGGLFN